MRHNQLHNTEHVARLNLDNQTSSNKMHDQNYDDIINDNIIVILTIYVILFISILMTLYKTPAVTHINGFVKTCDEVKIEKNQKILFTAYTS